MTKVAAVDQPANRPFGDSLQDVEELLRPMGPSRNIDLPEPPSRGAMWGLRMLVPRDIAEEVIGDLYEHYYEVMVPRFGQRRATLWLWHQVILTAGRLVSYSTIRALHARIRMLIRTS